MTTEPIAVDVPPKPVVVLPSKPAVPSAPAPKPEPPKATAKPPFPKPPAPAAGEPTFLQRFARNKAGIGAAALFSLAAGIAGVRLISPADDATPDAVAKQSGAADPKSPGALPKPSVIQEGLPNPDTIPPAGLPVKPVEGNTPVPTATDPMPLPPIKPVPDAPPVSGVPATGPIPPTLPGPTTPPAIPPATGGGGMGGDPPPPDLGDLGDPIIPVAGARPPKKDPVIPEVAKKDAASPELPKLPALPGTPNLDPVPSAKGDPPPLPKLDPGPGIIPVVPPAKLPDPPVLPMPKEKEPGKPVQGLPPETGNTNTGGGVVPKLPLPPPPTGGNVGVPPVAPDLGLPDTLPKTPPAPMPGAGAGTGAPAKFEFTKPAGGAAVAPVTANDRQPATNYDVDIYTPKPGDTWDAISREFYGDTRYAAGLSAYNRGQLARGRAVDVPPIHVVKKYMPANVATPAGGFGAGSAPDWGAATPPARAGGEKPYVVPGGLSMRGVARTVLGSEQRWTEIYNLNPHLKPDDVLPAGTELKMPPNARNP